MTRSESQRAENESAFRRANEELEARARELQFGDERTPYLCECDDLGCTAVVMLTRSEYEAVRSHPRRFFMIPGHEGPHDRAIGEHAGFHVIEKTGAAGLLVEQQDPRSSGRA